MNDEIKTTLAHPAVQAGWCDGCSPDNCGGCATPTAPANEALKNAALPWPWKTDAEVLDDAISAIEGQNRLKAALRSIAARTTPAASPAKAGEYPPLVCDYCGALTPDPWHSSGMLHGKMSKHIHSCDACAAQGAAQTAPVDTAVQRDAAIGMLADWVHAVNTNGTGWDDWDEHFKDAAFRPGPLRELLDNAIAARAAQGDDK